jgi:hypothetical protein
MTREFHCEGAPRDLGFDQGREFAADLRGEFDRQPAWNRWRQRLGGRTPASAPLQRDLRRHYPQQSETIEGLVAGARVPFAWFAERLAREFMGAAPVGAAVGAAIAAEPGLTSVGPLLVRSFATTPCVRHSRPEGGFASVELTLPWLAAAFAGVNESGLGVACVAEASASNASDCAVPASLLVQDCLARFDGIRGAVDWCTGRPASGRAVILLADASGAVAGVEIDGPARRELSPKDGLIVAGEAVDSADALRAAAPFDSARAAQSLGRCSAGIDPANRRISLHDRNAATTVWFGVAPAD